METVEQRDARVAALEEARREGGRTEDRALTVANTPAVMLPTTLAGPPASPRSALAIPDAWACVRTLAHAAASLPLHVYRRTDAGRERAEATTAARLFRRPAPGLSQSALVGHLVSSLALWGEGFIGMIHNPGGTAVEQLAVIAPDRVQVDAIGGQPRYGITTDDGRYVIADERHVIHVIGPMNDGRRGVSPITQVREAFGYAGALVAYGSAFMANGARPSGVLSLQNGGPHAEEMLDNLREGFEARHRGPLNAGRVALLLGEVKFEALSIPPADAEFLAQADYSTAQVARIFGVPPWMLGAKTGDSLTYSTVAEQARAFVTFALRPWLVAIEQAVSQSALMTDPNTYALFELDGLLRGDPQSRADFYASGIEHGWLTVNETRALEDLPALDRQEATADA